MIGPRKAMIGPSLAAAVANAAQNRHNATDSLPTLTAGDRLDPPRCRNRRLLMPALLVHRAPPTSVMPRTTFHCFSTTKPVTALAVLQLVAEGLVELDAP